MYYFFSPLVGENGKQVVRKAESGEWGELPSGIPFQFEEGSTIPLKILVMKRFEESMKHQLILHAIGSAAVTAIVKTMERLEGK